MPSPKRSQIGKTAIKAGGGDLTLKKNIGVKAQQKISKKISRRLKGET